MRIVILCPSYPAGAATLEIGRRGPDGVVRFHESPVVCRPVQSVRRAQHRLGIDHDGRFAGPCVTSACANWDGSCRLGRHISTLAFAGGQPCATSAECRWYAENGVAACHGCRLVVYVEAAG